MAKRPKSPAGQRPASRGGAGGRRPRPIIIISIIISGRILLEKDLFGNGPSETDFFFQMINFLGFLSAYLNLKTLTTLTTLLIIIIIIIIIMMMIIIQNLFSGGYKGGL